MSKSTIISLFIIGAIIIAGVLVWQLGYLPMGSNIPNPPACTQEAKICPDGSSVSRTGPNCEFESCLDEKLVCDLNKEYENTAIKSVGCVCPNGYNFEVIEMYWGTCPKEGMSDCQASKLKCVESSSLETDTADWKTYRSEKYGFEVKLPSDWLRIEMLNVSSVEWGNYVSFCLGDEGGQLWKIFDIGVYAKSDWEKMKKDKVAKITYLAENNSYIYAIISPDDIPFAAPSYLNSVNQILSTFKFINQ